MVSDKRKERVVLILPRFVLERIVSGGIISTLNDHDGRITKELVSSATKRITGLLISASNQRRKEKEERESMGSSNS